MIKEPTRWMWGWTWVRTWAADLRFGLRMMRRTPAMSAASILMLAGGMALNITVLCWLRAVTGKTLRGAREPQHLVEVLPS